MTSLVAMKDIPRQTTVHQIPTHGYKFKRSNQGTKYIKGSFAYYVISRGGGGFQMLTVDYGGGGGGVGR